MVRRLRLAFGEAVVFREEYERNIVNGGAFIRTREALEARDLVEVEVELGFCGESVVLDAEIVHVASAEQVGSEAASGVAVQFLEPASVLRDRLQRFVGGDGGTEADSAELDRRSLFGDEDISGADFEELLEERHADGASEAACYDPSEVDLSMSGGDQAQTVASDRRRAPRVRTRVQARVDAKTISLEGRTRDLSEVGALVSADASDLPIGKAVNLELAHPVSGDRLEVEGTVARHIETEGTVAAVGIEFGRDTGAAEVSTFLEEVNQVEKELKRTGIYGSIEELGIEALVRMFGTNARQGTLTLISGVEDGSIGFDGGMLRDAQLGELRGVKALSRFLSWERGSFEFHARLDPAEGEPDAMALEDAIAKAVRQCKDVIQAKQTGVLDPAARFTIDAETLRGETGLTKSQEAVLDLVAAGFSVRRILDVIPQPDAEVVEALKSLLDAEVLRPV